MDDFLGTDIALINGEVSATLGDTDVVTGRKCFIQDIINRLTTPRGDLWCHPDYGVDIYRFLHLEDSVVNRLDLIQTIEDEVMQDPRSDSVSVSIASWDGYKIRLQVSINPADETNPINLVLGYDLKSITMEVVTGG